ncbi:MAG TPA: cation:proton antiporter [Pirellulaceae bacterium]|nr:cation:proton antiporter [Pirellulaceae bacterium]
MEELGLLKDLLVVFIVASVVVYALHRIRVPAVVGLLLAGVVVGPYTLGLVHEEENVRLLAEIGVVVLLFTVGLEFSLSRLVKLWHVMLCIGLPQVLICGIGACLVMYWHIGAWGSAIFAGMLVAMSSTAVVLKLLIDRGELPAPQGRISVTVLLFQDLLVMVFMLTLPLLAPQTTAGESVWFGLLKGLGAMLAVLLATRFLIPQLLYHVVRTRNRELFLLLIVAVCLGTATMTAACGLSLALGAFLAGLALSDSEYAQQTLSEVLPFRDTLSSLFFVSVGMLLDMSYVIEHLPIVTATVAAMMLLKFSAVALPMLISGYPLRLAVLSGLALAQIGEFSFVLANRGGSLGLLSASDTQTFLAAAVITMALTPAMMAIGPKLVDWLPNFGSRRNWFTDDAEAEEHASLNKHVIICGYGINGRNVARILTDINIPFVVLEMNPVTVREQRRQGLPIFFGDCSRVAVLEHAGVHQASALMVAISDPATTRRAVQTARSLNENLHILARTRYLLDVDDLRRLGADEIVPEELETSIEIFARLLEHYHVPRNLIWDYVDRLRSDHYGALRDERRAPQRVQLPTEVLSQIDFELCLIRPDSPVVTRTLAEINLRAQTGATLIAVRRGVEMLTNPGPDFAFHEQDIAIILGDRPQLDSALLVLDPTLA